VQNPFDGKELRYIPRHMTAIIKISVTKVLCHVPGDRGLSGKATYNIINKNN
jgi:hypothetical protein